MSILAPARPPRVLVASGPSPAVRFRLGGTGRSLAGVLVGTATGLFVQSLGYGAGRAGNQGLALTGFFVGVVLIVVVCGPRLLGGDVSRRDRIAVSCILGLALAVSYYLLSPLLYNAYDDLLHQDTLWQWAARHGVPHNSYLPVSPDYPGLEALTLGVRWLSGLPLVLCELVTVLFARLVLVLAIFLVVERLTRSSQAAGAGVLLYAASPQFYAFNAEYSYQTLALAFGAGCVYLVVKALDERDGPRRRDMVLAAGCALATVVTHHLVGWLVVALLAAWGTLSRATGRRAAARTVGPVAAAAFLGAAVWTALSGPQLIDYLRPVLGGAVSGLVGVIDGSGGRRSLFQGAVGTVSTPLWEQVVMLAAAVVVVCLVAVASRGVLSGSTNLRGGRLRWIPVIAALGYLVVLVARLSANSQEVGGRLSTFVFFGIAVVVGAWAAARWRPTWKPLAVGLVLLCFLGGLLLGAGPSFEQVPGSYLPAADQRSVDAPSVAAARWAAAHLPPGAVVAADRDNGALMAALGHLTPESEASGGVNVGPLYFAHDWGPSDTALVRRAHIRYLVVDQRLAQGPPVFGTYTEPGETKGPVRLTPHELHKFARVRGIERLYGNGPIQIYDLSGLLGGSVPPRPAPTPGPTGIDWWLLVPAVGVAAIWGRRRPWLDADRALTRLLVGGLVVIGCAVVVYLVPVPATWAGLALLAVLGLWGWRRGSGVPWRRAGRSRRARGAGVLAGATAALLAAAAVGVAVASEASAWTPPTWLALGGPGARSGLVTVHLSQADPSAELVLRARGLTVWSAAVPSGRTTWTITLPPVPRQVSDQVVLVEHGQVVREVATRPLTSGPGPRLTTLSASRLPDGGVAITLQGLHPTGGRLLLRDGGLVIWWEAIPSGFGRFVASPPASLAAHADDTVVLVGGRIVERAPLTGVTVP